MCAQSSAGFFSGDNSSSAAPFANFALHSCMVASCAMLASLVLRQANGAGADLAADVKPESATMTGAVPEEIEAERVGNDAGESAAAASAAGSLAGNGHQSPAMGTRQRRRRTPNADGGTISSAMPTKQVVGLYPPQLSLLCSSGQTGSLTHGSRGQLCPG